MPCNTARDEALFTTPDLRVVLCDVAAADVTALHALAHAHEEVTDLKGGAHAYEVYEGDWQGSNLFANHVAWHKGLFLLELNKTDEALQLYDTYLIKDDGKGGKQAPPTLLGKPMHEKGATGAKLTPGVLCLPLTRSAVLCGSGLADAASLLWRINLMGVGVGDRWPILANLWKGVGGQRITSFYDMHRIMALASTSLEEARAEIEAMRSFINTPSPFAKDQAGKRRSACALIFRTEPMVCILTQPYMVNVCRSQVFRTYLTARSNRLIARC